MGNKRSSGSRVWFLIEAMRPHQWIKNTFVFAAPLFGKQLFEISTFLSASITFIGFSLLSSTVYLMNDLNDLEEDKQHPTKRKRPLPSGRLTPGLAKSMMCLLGVVSLALLLFISPQAGFIGMIYLVINVLYSMFVKHMVILDVMCIATGFILRLLAGAYATDVEPSYWLILCTLNVSLFLGFVKRRAELVVLGNAASEHRSVLADYSETFLDQMISIVTSATLICYILYTVDVRTVTDVHHTRMLVATVPFVMYGVFRYLYLTYHLKQGGSPTKAILVDKAFLANIFLWAFACALIIYQHDKLHALLGF